MPERKLTMVLCQCGQKMSADVPPERCFRCGARIADGAPHTQVYSYVDNAGRFRVEERKVGGSQ